MQRKTRRALSYRTRPADGAGQESGRIALPSLCQTRPAPDCLVTSQLQHQAGRHARWRVPSLPRAASAWAWRFALQRASLEVGSPLDANTNTQPQRHRPPDRQPRPDRLARTLSLDRRQSHGLQSDFCNSCPASREPYHIASRRYAAASACWLPYWPITPSARQCSATSPVHPACCMLREDTCDLSPA